MVYAEESSPKTCLGNPVKSGTQLIALFLRFLYLGSGMPNYLDAGVEVGRFVFHVAFAAEGDKTRAKERETSV